MAPPVPTVTLNNGVEMPIVGFGVFQIPPDETEQAVATALEAPTWPGRPGPRAGARFENGQLVERPTNQEVISKPRDQGGHETGRPDGRNFASGSAA